MSDAIETSPDDSYYELRLYEMISARLPRMHDLMGGQVPALFARHKVSRPLALWEGFSGPISPLYGYLLRWSNLDERMSAWGAFYSDPEWIAAMTENYAGAQNVERAHICFMKASPLWARFRRDGNAEIDGMYELRRYDLGNHRTDRDTDGLVAALDAAERDGGMVLGIFDVIIGAPCPQTVVFIAWKSRTDAVLPRTGTAGPSHDAFLLRPTYYGLARENFAEHPVG